MMHFSPTHPRSHSRGFTLIEILVVVAIFGLLSGISVFSVAQARTRAENTRTNAQMRSFIQVLETYRASNGALPLTSGIVCLGGSDCGNEVSSSLNAELERSTPDEANPMRDKIAFNTNGTPTYRAWYARCNNVAGVCDNDNIAEVIWYLEGQTADCGQGASRFVSEDEGNVACVYKLSGTGSVISDAVLGYDNGAPVEYCEDSTACNYGSIGSCDYSCNEPTTCDDSTACNYGQSASCDYSCQCPDPSACNYSGSSNGDYSSCDYTCQAQCGDSTACNYGAYESCTYDCCTDPSACNYNDPSSTYCDYSCQSTTCWDSGACNYGQDGECTYSCGYCDDAGACNYGSYESCDYSCQSQETCWDGSACNYGSYGSCDYSCYSYDDTCWDGAACNYGSTGGCDYSCIDP